MILVKSGHLVNQWHRMFFHPFRTTIHFIIDWIKFNISKDCYMIFFVVIYSMRKKDLKILEWDRAKPIGIMKIQGFIYPMLANDTCASHDICSWVIN